MKIKICFLCILTIVFAFSGCKATENMDILIFSEKFNSISKDNKILLENIMAFEEEGSIKHSYILNNDGGEAKYLITTKSAKGSSQLVSCTLTSDKFVDEESAINFNTLATQITEAFTSFDEETLNKLSDLELLNPSTYPTQGIKTVDSEKYTMRLIVMQIGLSFYIEQLN